MKIYELGTWARGYYELMHLSVSLEKKDEWLAKSHQNSCRIRDLEDWDESQAKTTKEESSVAERSKAVEGPGGHREHQTGIVVIKHPGRTYICSSFVKANG